MKRFRTSIVRAILALSLLSMLLPNSKAATIFQAANSQTVAWEAENVYSISNSAPTTWVATNDVSGSGGRALYAAGVNQTATPASFALFAIKFRSAGTYSLYLRWRADSRFTDLDGNSGNSYYRPIDFGNLSTNASDYATSSANNSRTPPAVNSYGMTLEGSTYTVTQEQVDAGAPLILRIGTREAGMFIDRFVLSQNGALTEADFNALDNSDTDIINQGAGETFVAFEAERISKIVNSTPTMWVATNDATASGGQALYAAGVNQTATPASFASYAIKFRTAGTYNLYLRWRADSRFTDLDGNSGNSYYRPVDFGDLSTNLSDYATSSANNSRTPPAVNSYGMTLEGLTYIVTQEQVDAGLPLTLKIGTREAGMFIDRFVLSQSATLTEADFNGLANSGSVARPGLVKAVGSAGLNKVTVTFDRPLSPASVTAAKFALSGGVTVSAANLNLNTSKDVVLTTSVQAQGSNYVVTVNGVTDVNNSAIAANSTVKFTSWKLATGWITRDLYYNVTGGTVGDLQGAPNYPDSPDATAFVRSVSVGGDLQVANYGARFRGYFTPAQNGAYEVYLYGDDDAILSLSPNTSAAGLTQVLQRNAGDTNFSANGLYTSGNLVAGQSYLFEVLYKQDTGTASLGLAVRRVGTTGPVEQLLGLGGSVVSTFVNPDAGVVKISAQPASATIPAGTRAKLSVTATSPSGGTLFYQWQVNGVDIAGATRPNFVTPILSAADSGKKYRCVVGVNGADVPSQEAIITVGPAVFNPLQPYVGVNFIGGGGVGTTIGYALATNDIAGAVLQGNFNNLAGTAIDGTQALVDAQGAATPVTVAVWDPVAGGTVAAGAALGTGTGNLSADSAMMQGYIANNNLPLSLEIAGVPAGKYNLIVYSVGFNFNSTYEEDFDLVGARTNQTLTVRAQHAAEWVGAPTLVRMSSTNPANRDRGNYVMIENVSPAADGTFLLTVTPQSTVVGNPAYFPAVNALQLVKVIAATVQPKLTTAIQGANVTITWTAEAAGFVLESSTTLGSTASWSAVSGAPSPITAAGSVNAVNGASRFYRLRK